MGMTLTEKIIASHAELESVRPGDRVTVKVDRFLLDATTFAGLFEAARRRNLTGLNPPRPIITALDQFVEPRDEGGMDVLGAVRPFAKDWGVQQLYELGRGGVEAVVFPDGGFVRPGDLLCTGHPRLAVFGVLGALSLPLRGADLLDAVQSGTITLEVPDTVRVVFRGSLQRWVGGKDLAMHAFNLLGPEEIRGKALEFNGETVRALDMADRLALGAFAANLGAGHLLMQPDAKTEAFVRARSDTAFPLPLNDEDARFDDLVEEDAANLEPQLFLSRHRGAVNISKAGKMKIRQVVIGTGGNGRIEDLRIAAGLLREYQVHPEVRLIVIPGSQQVYLHAMEEGLIQAFVRSGAHIGPPSEGYAGQCHRFGMMPGERCLTTSGCLYDDLENLEDREILYGNPAVAAASAVMGCMSSPFGMLRAVKRMPTGLMG